MAGLFDDMLNILRVGAASDMTPETMAHRQLLLDIIVDGVVRNSPLFGERGLLDRAIRSFDVYPVAIRALGDADDHMPEIAVDIIDDKRTQCDYAALEYGNSNPFSA